jgi:hypothetical protein
MAMSPHRISLCCRPVLTFIHLEKKVITREEFMHKISEERATYQKLLNPIVCPGFDIKRICAILPMIAICPTLNKLSQ